MGWMRDEQEQVGASKLAIRGALPELWWGRTHKRWCLRRLGVVAGELEKVGLGGHLRVVSVR